ncbi:hypothetical protein GJ496_000635 [Pomphorhynchus laevis]|nr:hypothetical protein GJ496_000635 [Pomphorhynchus laevis]
MVNRLYYRKGLDLAVQVIPVICSRFSNIKFVIAGDGPKMDDLLAMREFHRLEKRVILLGTVPHDKIKDVLKQGHIFLNCSIAEVFCISILEAAYFGLLVVTTNVGGIIEVLPDSNPQVVRYTEANVYSIIKVLSKAIKEVNYINQSDLEKLRHKLQIVYNWHSVAERTEQVYNVLKPPPGKLQILMRFLKMRTCAGFIYFLILLGNVFYLYILDKLCT